jgi:hypothetical protein
VELSFQVILEVRETPRRSVCLAATRGMLQANGKIKQPRRASAKGRFAEPSANGTCAPRVSAAL